MPRVGRCIDNGPMEGFFGILKTEMFYLNPFHSEQEQRDAIDKYIDFYNNGRSQENLNGMTPIQFRNQPLAA
ncbi:MAG: IS3 family transposase [Christensenellaceae bacterium]|jgi:transposase InsO family protein|nr:IS3 family transposase [Christensenellaceae bacterium]